MKMYGGLDIYIHVFWTPTLVGGEGFGGKAGKKETARKT
jgi:hypothetical protein